MKKFVATYLLGYLISWTLIAGWVNADHQYDSQNTHLAILYTNPEEAKYKYRSDWGFAVVWSGCASLMWPIFLPGTYIIGLAQHGWTLDIQPPEKAGKP